MIVLPSFAALPRARLYRDSDDDQVVYVDALDPSPVPGRPATRWMPLTAGEGYLVGEVCFAAGEEAFAAAARAFPGRRPVPVPWQIAPVVVWTADEGGRVLGEAKTSGYGSSNAVFNGAAPLKAMAAPVVVAAELSCPARVEGVRVSADGDPAAVAAALPSLGAPADPRPTLGEALVALLARLLETGALSVHVETDDEAPATATGEMREAVLMEWASRARAAFDLGKTLAAPAAVPDLARPAGRFDLAVGWGPGGVAPLRVVRVFRSG